MSRAGAVWRDLCADRRKDAIAVRGTGEGGKKKGGSSPFCMDHVPHRLSVAFGDLRAKGGSSLF